MFNVIAFLFYFIFCHAWQVNVESHSDHDLFGEGGIAFDYTGKRGVEDYKLREAGHILPVNVYFLQRFDITPHKARLRKRKKKRIDN